MEQLARIRQEKEYVTSAFLHNKYVKVISEGTVLEE